MFSSPSATHAPLVRLLGLAGELLAATDLKTVLELLGPTLRDTLAPDESLIVLAPDDPPFMAAFDPAGHLCRADRTGALALRTQQALHQQRPLILPTVHVDAGPAGYPHRASLVALPLPRAPAPSAIGALWHQPASELWLAQAVDLLEHLVALAGAALANVDLRLTQDEEMVVRTEEALAATREQALEAQRREVQDRSRDHAVVTDELTGMLNRRGFFLHAEQSFKLARRQHAACTVIFADIDGLHGVNASLGHDMGDHLIRAGAQILRASLRDSDVLARLGADEFAAFAIDAGQPENILARIHENALAFHRRVATPYRVTFRTGIVQCDPGTELTLADYVAMAEQRRHEIRKTHHG